MKKLSISARHVMLARFLILIVSFIPVIYLLYLQWFAEKPVNEENLAITEGIAASFLWFLIMPSLIIIIALLLRIVFIRWLIPVWDIIFLVVLGQYTMILLFVAIPVALYEVILLFTSPLIVQNDS